ncbi:MAG: zinc-ribbon domain-containing protein, partial [Acidobacteriota bacterium]
ETRIIMFCPKCGSQNADETKFCRGCGSDLSNVLAVIDGRETPNAASLSEKHIELFSSGLRGLITGSGFILVSALALALSPKLSIVTLLALAFAFFFIGIGVSRLVQGRSLKRLLEGKTRKVPKAALVPGEPEYIRSSRSVYETEDLLTPRSITEHTTTHLKMDDLGSGERPG